MFGLNLSALADQAQVPLPELLARLAHAGIELTDESAILGHVHGLVQENQGVVGNQYVSGYATDDDSRIKIAAAQLPAFLRGRFRQIPQIPGMSGDALQRVRECAFECWHERGAYHGPSGEYLGYGWQLHFRVIGDDIHPAVIAALKELPDQWQGFDLFCANEFATARRAPTEKD